MRVSEDFPHSTSSARPERLLTYQARVSLGERAVSQVLPARVRSALAAFLASRPEYGSDAPSLDRAISVHLERSLALSDWVGRVACAFREAGDQSTAVCPATTDGPAAGCDLWTAGDHALAAQFFADSSSAAVERAQARALADAFNHDRSRLEATRRDMSVLADHRGDLIFVTAFFNRLGPTGMLQLERALVEMTRYDSYAAYDGPDAFVQLIQPLNLALSAATRGGGLTTADHLDPNFTRGLLDRWDLTPADLSNLLQSSWYSTDFLVAVGRRLIQFKRFEFALSGFPAMLAERWPGVAVSGSDPLVSVLQAIGRDPLACATLLSDGDLAGKFLDVGARTDPALMSVIAREAAVDYVGSAGRRDSAAFNVALHFAAAGAATPEMRHVLSAIATQHIAELAADADLPTGGASRIRPDGMDFSLPDLEKLLRLATTDSADMRRVLDAMSAWAAAALTTDAVEGSTARVGRAYGMLVRANDLQVRDAAAADERRRQILDSVDKVVGLIPVAGGAFVEVGAGAARTFGGDFVKGLAQTHQAAAATENANTFNDSMIRRLDYLAAAAALARDPERLATRIPPPLVVEGAGIRLAREDEAPAAYRRWYGAHSGDLAQTRTEIDTGYLVRASRSGR